MAFLRTGFLVILTLSFVAPGFAQQSADNQNLFTITVAPPTKAKDVQVRYYFSGETNGFAESAASPTKDNTIVIKTGAEAKSAKSFKLIAYAPGCQFVTISVDDLASSNRQGAFQCTPLNTVEFRGQANVSALSGKALDVQVLYACDWAAQFFGAPGTAVSPFSLGKAQIGSDGSFVFDLPDFSADPLWSTLSSNARLSFYAVDDSNGEPLGTLKAAGESSVAGGGVKVASSYPEVQFSTQSNVIDDRINR